MSDEKPPAWAIDLQDTVAKGLATLSSKVDTLAENVDILNHDAKDTRSRLGRMEREVDEVKSRQNSASLRAQAPSSHDLETASALAQEVTARQALAGEVAELRKETAMQTAMLEKLTTAGAKVMANPTVRTIVILAGAAIIAWLKGHIQ